MEAKKEPANLQKIPDGNEECFQNLAQAIVVQAARDYTDALKILKKDPDNYMAQREIRTIEGFFHGKLYAAITTLNPDRILKSLRMEVEKS